MLIGALLTGLVVNCETGFAQAKPSNRFGRFGVNQPFGKRSEEGPDRRPHYSVDKRGGIVYRKGKDFELKCDLYLPSAVKGRDVTEASEHFPAIIAVHGGAWRSGSKVTMLRHANLFTKSGYVVMAINYRHAPTHPFPAQIHDCKFAVRWLKANAETYHVDPVRVGAFGYSAGAHLVALLGVTGEHEELDGPMPKEFSEFDSRIVCASVGGTPCEFSWIGEDSTVLKSWIGATRRVAPDRYRKASPLSYVDSKDVPFFFFHGEHDLVVPPNSSLKMHQALAEEGVESTREIALLSGHLSTFSNMIWAKKSLKFFDQYLKLTVENDAAE